MNIYDFRIEYRKEPKGLSVRQPRFSWKLLSEEKDTMQTAWQLLVTTDGKAAWDSGRNMSAQSVLVPYMGEELQEETRYQVKLIVEDNHGKTAECTTSFETGIFDPGMLKAEMITHDFPAEETACPVFYRNFRLEKKVLEACMYATAHGVYELSVNGQRVGRDYMAPGWTSYHKRLQYQYYDITEYLRGENEVTVTVGNGWYKSILGFDCKPNRYGDRVETLAEIHILYEDGSRDTIITDESWKVRTGEIRYSEIYMGETIDTDALEITEGKVTVVPFDKTVLEAQENEPVRITQRISPIEIFTDPQGRKLVDFGQNITGLAEVKIKGKKGQKITVRHAETLDKDGCFYPDTLRTAKSEDTYICNGTEQVFMPHFTFHGFRYIAVEGIDEPVPEMFTACAMHSDIEKIGDFHCYNKKVNQLQSNISWGLRDNFFDIPTDCPQRDERLGWMGDAQVFSWTAAFNRNTAQFFTKWMRDIAADSSLENGVPHVVPDIMRSRRREVNLERIIVKGTKFVTESGREVLLQGINFVCKEKEMGYLWPEHEKLFAWFAECGFNLIRLGIFWDAVEPRPGKYDDAYLEKIRKVILEAERNRLYVLVDMHQDLWSVLYGDGAPEWATITDGAAHPSDCAMWFDAYLRSDAIINAVEHFWNNDKAEDGIGLIDHYADMWGYIAEKLAGCENIIGYEPMNEPFMGSLARNTFGMAAAKTREKYPEFDFTTMQGVTPESQAYMSRIVGEAFVEFDKNTLMPFYQRMHDVLRTRTTAALATGGNIYCSANFPSGIGRVSGADGEESQQIYAPHGYDSVVDSDRYENFNRENVENLFAVKREEQEQLGMPVIVGEWGAFPSKDFTGKLIEHMNLILEKYLWSSAYWQYLPGMEEDLNYDALRRAYPAETDGKLKSYHYARTKRTLFVTLSGKELLCYVPFVKFEVSGKTGIRVNIVKKMEKGMWLTMVMSEEGEGTIVIQALE